MKLCPPYGTEFVRDRPLWLYVALHVFYALIVLLSLIFTDGQPDLTEMPPPNSPEEAAMRDALLGSVRIFTVAICFLFAVFLCFWSWMATQPHRLAWIAVMVLQALALVASFFGMLMSLLAFAAFELLASSFGASSDQVTSTLPFDSQVYFGLLLGLGVLDTLISILVTYWWWQRRHMHNVPIRDL